MPTIAQLPQATAVSAADTLPLSQAGRTKSASLATILGSVQPVITVASPALLGRTSLGSGGPEQVNLGDGLGWSQAMLVANGFDHAHFPAATALAVGSDLVISEHGTPMLMATSLLRNLFTPGQNIAITAGGTISAMAAPATAQTLSALPTVTSIASQDLISVSEAGVNCAITYANLLGGITIDQAPVAAPVADADTFWTAQGSSSLFKQNLGSIWTWITGKIPSYKAPVMEITANINLDAALHNGRILVCSQPVTLTPLTVNMGSGFQCTVINAGMGNVTFGSGFTTSTGGYVLPPSQCAQVFCAIFSGGVLTFASIGGATPSVQAPGQATGLSLLAATQTTISLAWQSPVSGGPVSFYTVQSRPSAGASWTTSPPVASALTYQLTNLQPGTSYNVTVQASNATGTGPVSSVLTASTSAVTPVAVPPQPTAVSASSTSSSSIQVAWAAQTGASAAASFTVQYRTTGSSTWTGSVAGILSNGTVITGLQPGTSYDLAIYGVNASGSGLASAPVTATTAAAARSVSSITWNLLPAGPYTRSSGAIGVNAHVSPTTSPIQFGFSLSASAPPTTWTSAGYVNTDLWGAYVPTPAVAGTWFTWAEGIDGSAPTVSSSSFQVQ